MNKKRVYDEMLQKIDCVLQGELKPEAFAEELCNKILDLDAQVSSLSDMLARMENEHRDILGMMEQQAKMIDRSGALIDGNLQLVENQIAINSAVLNLIHLLTQREEHTP